MLGDFDYEEQPDDIEGLLEKRPKYTYESGDTYIGDWLKGTQIRQGKGLLIYKNGDI